jgi:hypothetical protein
LKLLLTLFILFSSISIPANAQLIPTTGLPLYGTYRKYLIKQGWKPKPSPVKNYAGQGWDEFICGNAICNGIFTSPKGTRSFIIIIWMKHGLDLNDTEYYVAPQFDVIEEQN